MSLWVYATYVQVPVELRKWCQRLSYRWLWAVMYVCWKLNLGPLQEEPMFLTTEHSLQPLLFLVCVCYCRLSIGPLHARWAFYSSDPGVIFFFHLSPSPHRLIIQSWSSCFSFLSMCPISKLPQVKFFTCLELAGWSKQHIFLLVNFAFLLQKGTFFNNSADPKDYWQI